MSKKLVHQCDLCGCDVGGQHNLVQVPIDAKPTALFPVQSRIQRFFDRNVNERYCDICVDCLITIREMREARLKSMVVDVEIDSEEKEEETWE